MSKLIHPFHYQIYRREGVDWFVKEGGKLFYNSTDQPVSLTHVEHQFGLTEEKVIIELFRINGGRSGYYLANLRDRHYYYCGVEWNDVKITLQQLGLGREDPHKT